METNLETLHQDLLNRQQKYLAQIKNSPYHICKDTDSPSTNYATECDLSYDVWLFAAQYQTYIDNLEAIILDFLSEHPLPQSEQEEFLQILSDCKLPLC
jgi:hypothetical protein